MKVAAVTTNQPLVENVRFQSLPFIIVAFVSALMLIQASLHFSYTPDDSYIYFQYARNIVDTGEVAFNKGEPSYGVTGPIWMLLAAFIRLFTGDFVQAVKMVDLGLAVLSITVFYSAAKRLVSDKKIALLGVICLATNAWFVRWAGSGMETSMVVLVSCVILRFLLLGRVILTLSLLGILCLLRPEAALLCPATIMYFVSFGDKSKVGRKQILQGLALLSVIVLSWMVYSKVIFGSVLPNTAAKAGWNFTLVEFRETSVDLIKTLAASDGVLIMTLALIVPYGCYRLYRKHRRRPGWEVWSTHKNFLFLLWWIVVVLLFYVISGTNVVSRYLLLVSPAIILLLLYSHEWFVSEYSHLSYRFARIAILVVAMHTLENQIFYWVIVKPGISAFQDGMEATLIRMGHWLKENTPQDSRVLVTDIGALGYFSCRALDDAGGLISPQAIPLLRSGLSPDDIIATGKYRQWSRPNYIVHRDTIPKALEPNSRLEPVLVTEFPKMRLDDKKSTYYTVYRVRH